MSAGLGVYAAIPGGGSLESSDISRMRRALVAGFIVVVVCYEGKIWLMPFFVACFTLVFFALVSRV